MKTSLTLLRPASNYFNCLRDESDEVIHSNNTEYMRYFVHKSIESGRCTTSNQHCKPDIIDQVFNIISTELKVRGNTCEILHEYIEYVKNIRRYLKKKLQHELTIMKKLTKVRRQMMPTISLVN